MVIIACAECHERDIDVIHCTKPLEKHSKMMLANHCPICDKKKPLYLCLRYGRLSVEGDADGSL